MTDDITALTESLAGMIEDLVALLEKLADGVAAALAPLRAVSGHGPAPPGPGPGAPGGGLPGLTGQAGPPWTASQAGPPWTASQAGAGGALPASHTGVAATTGGAPGGGSHGRGGGGGSNVAGALLSIANSLGGGLKDLTAKVLDLVVPGLGTLAETLLNVVAALLQWPEKVLAAVRPFVEALNPNLLLAFNTQLANLSATVGTAFQDVFNILAPALDRAAGLLQGAMEALRPVVDVVAEVFGDLFIASVDATVAVLRPLVPALKAFVAALEAPLLALQMAMQPVLALFQLLAAALQILTAPLAAFSGVIHELFHGFQAIMEIFNTAVATATEVFTEFVASLFGVDLQDALASVVDYLKMAVSNLVQVIAFIAKILQANAFLDRFIANLEARVHPKHAVAAPRDVSIKGVEAITRDLAVSAFSAGGGTHKSQTDYLKEALEELKRLRDDPTLENFLEVKFNELIEALNPLHRARRQVEEWHRRHPVMGAVSMLPILGMPISGF